MKHKKLCNTDSDNKICLNRTRNRLDFAQKNLNKHAFWSSERIFFTVYNWIVGGIKTNQSQRRFSLLVR